LFPQLSIIEITNGKIYKQGKNGKSINGKEVAFKAAVISDGYY
jgi:hypothetical protein